MTYSRRHGWAYGIVAVLLMMGLSLLLAVSLGFWAQCILLGAAPFIGAAAYSRGASRGR